MSLQGRRVLVTGATGFIGGQVARRLLKEGAEVSALVRRGSDAGALEALGVRVLRGDVTMPATLDFSGQDVVVHAAAWVGFAIPPRKRELFRRTNVQGTRNVIHAAKSADVRKIVHVSSVAALGATDARPATEESPRSTYFKSEYERTKTEAHEAALQAGVPVALPMPGLVLGRDSGFDWLFRSLAKGRLPALPADDAEKGWVHLDDVAEALVTMASRGQGPYLLVDENLRLTELLVRALEEAGLPIPRRRVPVAVLRAGAWAVEKSFHAFGRTPPVSDELMRALPIPMSYDSARARKELGWRPALVRRLADDLQAFARGP